MQIIQTERSREFELSENFLEPYRLKGDAFPTLLARSTYLTKYCRNTETWTDTIRRVVEGNVNLVPGVSTCEAEMLFHLFWTGQVLPPGRSLWVGGIPNIPADARFNCWFVTLRSIDDWCWVADRLMLGGGVGVGLYGSNELPRVSETSSRLAIWCRDDHPNYDEVQPDPKSFLNGQTPIFRVPDSRQGWVQALWIALKVAFAGEDWILDVSDIRPRGEPIRTFGGTACGPGPLSSMLRSVWEIVRSASGKKLSSVNCLDITNHIGFCVKSGNVRRSALIVLGSPDDREFRNAKRDFEAIKNHRHTSNNTLAFRTEEQIANFDWEALVEDLAVYGEPGILNLPLVWKTDPEAEGLNPCLVGESRVATHLGLLRIDRLEELGIPLEVSVDTRVQENYRVDLKLVGTQSFNAVPAFKTSDSERVFRVTTKRGYSLTATARHKFPTPSGFVRLEDLREGSLLLLQSEEGQWGSKGDEDTGFALGNLIANSELGDALYSDCLDCSEDRAGYVPESIWCGSSDCVAGFIRGVFSAKGHVTWFENKQPIKLQIRDVPDTLLADLQVLLSNFGIVSNLGVFDLTISDSNAHEFSSKIGFHDEKHRSEFMAWLASEGNFVCAETFLDEVLSIDFVGTRAVYCTTQGDRHSFIANGIVTGNCGEQALHNREACNLAEVFPAKFQDTTDPDLAFRLATRYCMRQRLTPLLDPVSDAVGRKNMRVGISLGGICDFDWSEGLLSRYFRQCREEADSYAKELKVARPLTVTTVKPSGTLSLLFGSSPGIHAPFAPYYIRRTRLASNDPLIEPLIEAGVPFEWDVYDNTKHTLVFSFPMRAAHTKVTVQTQTVRDQMQRQATVQKYWADNAVSSTISFGVDEKAELSSCLREFVPQLKSVSCLPKEHGYAQAPYEEIDEATYVSMSGNIDYKHPLVRGGDMDDGGECSGGACPIR